MSLQLREITKDTVREVCALEVREEQKGYVAGNALSIAQAHFEPSAVFRAICVCDRPVGFVLWRNAETPGTAVLWRFMIDRSHQAVGHGRDALALALRQMKSSGFEHVETSVLLGPETPLGFYLLQGFSETGRTTSGGEWLLRRPLRLGSG